LGLWDDTASVRPCRECKGEIDLLITDIVTAARLRLLVYARRETNH
jgi:hypothetical protein